MSDGRSAPDAYGVAPVLKLIGVLALFIYGIVACVRWALAEPSVPFVGLILMWITVGLAMILPGLTAKALRRPPR